jgi:transposase InsO family protein
MARSTFYYYLKQTDQPDKYISLRSLINAIYHQHKGRYGYRRITITLKQSGYQVNHKTVSKLMAECNLKSVVRVKKYKSYRGEQGKIAENLLKRNFKAVRPYQKWVTDITEFSVGGKKLYFSPIMDLYNGEIVSYNLSERPCLSQIMDMLEKALSCLPSKTRLILHSDQGWQYQMRQYQATLKKRKIRQSMSRKGNCLDNAAMESFFSILKSELFYLDKFDSVETLKKDIISYIDYYNNDRIKLKLKGLSPVKYRAQAA